MTPAEFRARLSRLDLSGPAFARRVEEIGGERLPPRTVQNWELGYREIPPLVPAVLALMERGERLEYLAKGVGVGREGASPG